VNRRLFAVLAAPVAVAACATPGAATTVTVTATPPSKAADVPAMSDDDEFLMLLYAESRDFALLDRRTLLDVGRGICGALDEGYSVEDIGDVTLSSGLDSDDAAALVAAAIVAICPEHRL